MSDLDLRTELAIYFDKYGFFMNTENVLHFLREHDRKITEKQRTKDAEIVRKLAVLVMSKDGVVLSPREQYAQAIEEQ